MLKRVTFQSSYPRSFHAKMAYRLRGYDESIEHKPLMRLAYEIPNDPVVLAIARGMLHAEPVIDPCCHLHLNESPEPGPWHRDDYCGKPWPKPFLILFYLPQEVTNEMGPTELFADTLLNGDAGTCALISHDVLHRSTPNTTGRRRVMLKFLLC